MKQWLTNIKPVTLIRRVTQLISFILIPGLFTTVYYGIKEIYTSIISGKFTTSTISSQIFLLMATLLSTLILGRFFCGFFCGFGTMGDFIWFLSSKTFRPKIKISEKVDGLLKYVKYVLLLILILLWTFPIIKIDATSNPWNIFGIYSTLSSFTNLTYFISIGGLLLLLIIIGSFFIERFFCRYLCPLGAIFALVSKFRIFNIRKKRDTCGSCRMCTSKCSMGIPLYKYDKVTSGDCINCFACVSHCPRSNAKVNPTPTVASVASVAVISGLLYVGNITSETTSDHKSVSTTAAQTATQTEAGKYTDGTYTGTGTGFRGDTSVSVQVENGYISDITITSYVDDERFFSKAENTIITEIVDSQDVNVDTVSGATFSSNGIMEAVANALNISYTNPNSTMSRNSHGGHDAFGNR